jgi:predicted transcriptional regulator
MSNTQQERTVALGFYASESIAEWLKQAAREQDRSVSAVIRQALEAELQRESEQVTS